MTNEAIIPLRRHRNPLQPAQKHCKTLPLHRMKESVSNTWEDQFSCRFSYWSNFYVFIQGEAVVKTDSKQFSAGDSLYDLILESDF